MEAQKREKFAEFLRGYVKKNGRKLGQRTIFGVLTLAKFLPEEDPVSLKPIHSNVYSEVENIYKDEN